MKNHELKIHPEYYDVVKNGTKTFEVRNNDRDFKSGDTVVLREWCPIKKDYTDSCPLFFNIGYVLVLPGGAEAYKQYVAFSLLPMEL